MLACLHPPTNQSITPIKAYYYVLLWQITGLFFWFMILQNMAIDLWIHNLSVLAFPDVLSTYYERRFGFFPKIKSCLDVWRGRFGWSSLLDTPETQRWFSNDFFQVLTTHNTSSTTTTRTTRNIVTRSRDQSVNASARVCGISTRTIQ